VPTLRNAQRHEAPAGFMNRQGQVAGRTFALGTVKRNSQATASPPTVACRYRRMRYRLKRYRDLPHWKSVG